jgi:hypothetical protein
MKVRDLSRSGGQRYRYYRLRRSILGGVPEFVRESAFGGRWVNERLKIVEVCGCRSREDLIQRNRYVRLGLRRIGLNYEDCFVSVADADGKRCWLKGLLRLAKDMTDAGLKKVLAEAWLKQGVADVELVRYEVIGWGVIGDYRNELTRYIRKVMLQGVADGEYRLRHLVKSAGWKLESGAVSGPGWFHIVGQGKVVKEVAVKAGLTQAEYDDLAFPVQFREGATDEVAPLGW